MADPTKADESLLRRLNYEYPYFESYVEPKGALKVDRACHACFYYGMLAIKAIQTQGSGIESQMIVYEVGSTPPPWFEARLDDIAKSVALMYALQTPDDFLRYRKEAWAQAAMIGVEIPEYVFNVRPGSRAH